MASRPILQLEETVINRIAAGEVVVRPANALKELIENSLDANGKRIVIMVKSGGLKMLRIEDDGHGIRAEDLPILCERFTTSKLEKYEDLQSIGTFGFRGEALASISHVAQVTVTTMTNNDDCAHVAQYSEGKLQGSVRPCAGTRGTTLVVENMFFNNFTRRQALRESIEHSKVLEVTQRYAIHYPHVAFTCRKYNGAAELTTAGGADQREVIATIWGQGLSRELFPFELESEEPRFSFKGFASNPNYSTRSSTLVLFINNRLVDCAPLKRAVEAVYQPVLPRHQHPWVYLALQLDPGSIDVNVHPTKMEVQFLHEETISQRLQESLSAQLRSMGTSRSFTSVLPSPGKTFTLERQLEREPAAAPVEPSAKPKPSRIRTDHRQKSLESMLSQATEIATVQTVQTVQTKTAQATAATETEATELRPSETGALTDPDAETRLEAFREVQQLTSVAELRKAVEHSCDDKLTEVLKKSVYVGPVNHELILLQCGASLCLANLAVLARECAYQRILRLIGGMGCIALAEPLPLNDLLQLALEEGFEKSDLQDSLQDSLRDPLHQVGAHGKCHGHERLADRFEGLLLEKADLLREYFLLEIEVNETSKEIEESKSERKTSGRLKTLPNGLGLVSDAGCSFHSLPSFILRLCTEVNWKHEKACLDGICQIAADFSADLLLPDVFDASDRAATDAMNAAVASGEFEDVAAAAKRPRTQELQQLQWLHEAVRRETTKWPRHFSNDGTLVDLVSLDQLYKIFERC